MDTYEVVDWIANVIAEAEAEQMRVFLEGDSFIIDLGDSKYKFTAAKL